MSLFFDNKMCLDCFKKRKSSHQEIVVTSKSSNVHKWVNSRSYMSRNHISEITNFWYSAIYTEIDICFRYFLILNLFHTLVLTEKLWDFLIETPEFLKYFIDIWVTVVTLWRLVSMNMLTIWNKRSYLSGSNELTQRERSSCKKILEKTGQIRSFKLNTSRLFSLLCPPLFHYSPSLFQNVLSIRRQLC